MWSFMVIDSAVPEKTLFNIFLQCNMAAKTCDQSIIPSQTFTPKDWRTFLWNFPSICPVVLEKKIFVGFRVNPIWLPNHVTYDITWVNVLFLMDRRSYYCGAGRRPRARPLDGAAKSARQITRNLDRTFLEKSEKYGSLIGPWRVNISTTWYRVIRQFSKYLETTWRFTESPHPRRHPYGTSRLAYSNRVRPKRLIAEIRWSNCSITAATAWLIFQHAAR